MAKMGKVSFSYSTCKFWYHPHSIVVLHAAQQGMHWTLEILRHFQAFSSLRVFSALKHYPRPPQRQ
jgi:hypothetical protein